MVRLVGREHTWVGSHWFGWIGSEVVYTKRLEELLRSVFAPNCNCKDSYKRLGRVRCN